MSNRNRRPANVGGTIQDVARMAQAYMEELNRRVEAAAREGFAQRGRGFVLFVMGQDEPIEPFIEYHTLADTDEIPNLTEHEGIVANVGSYDPAGQLVVVIGRMHFGRRQLEDVDTSIRPYTATPASSPPVA